MSINPKKIVGLKIRTSNENGQASRDIPQLWERFMQIQIPERLNDTIYVAYFDYEKDFTKPYSCLIGFEIAPEITISDKYEFHTLPSAKYQIFETKGPLPQSLIELWGQIWQAPLKRSYQTDFEVYDPASPTAIICIGIN
jgi:predicted transcriptional regulator YdeE